MEFENKAVAKAGIWYYEYPNICHLGSLNPFIF